MLCGSEEWIYMEWNLLPASHSKWIKPDWKTKTLDTSMCVWILFIWHCWTGASSLISSSLQSWPYGQKRRGEQRGSLSPLKTGGEHCVNRFHIAELHMHQLFLIQSTTASLSINSYHADQQYIKFLTWLALLSIFAEHNIKKTGIAMHAGGREELWALSDCGRV